MRIRQAFVNVGALIVTLIPADRYLAIALAFISLPPCCRPRVIVTSRQGHHAERGAKHADECPLGQCLPVRSDGPKQSPKALECVEKVWPALLIPAYRLGFVGAGGSDAPLNSAILHVPLEKSLTVPPIRRFKTFQQAFD
jgi:hypothetical protein